MIQINNITINKEGNKLRINAEIKGDSAFFNRYIKKIYLDTQDSFLTSGPSEDLVYEHDITTYDAADEQNAIVTINTVDRVRKLDIEIPQEEIDAALPHNMFIVYLEAGGENTDQPPADCCENIEIVVGAVIWMKPLYGDFLAFSRELNNSCEIPKNFLYIFLQYQAFLVAVRTNNMLEAIRIYNEFLRHKDCVPRGNAKIGCGCRR